MGKIKAIASRVQNGNKEMRKKDVLFSKDEKGGLRYALAGFSEMLSGSYFGGNQSWFLDEGAANEGCGYVAVANCYAWSKYKNDRKSYNKENFLKIMNEVYFCKNVVKDYLNANMGIISRVGLRELANKFANNKNTTASYQNVQFKEIIINISKLSASEIKNRIVNIESAIRNQLPVLMLFTSGNSSPFGLHWVTITSTQEILNSKGEIKDYWIGVSTWGELQYFRYSNVGVSCFCISLTFK